MFLLIILILLGIIISVIYSISNLIEAENTIISKIENSNKKYTVYIFERNAGATTDYSTQITILRSNKKFRNSPGNIFIADRGQAELSDFGIINIDVIWEDQNTLIIKYDKKARIFIRKDTFENIQIKYIEL